MCAIIRLNNTTTTHIINIINNTNPNTGDDDVSKIVRS